MTLDKVRAIGGQASLAALAMMAAAIAWAAYAIPEGVPIALHWNLAGEVDHYGDRAEALFALAIFPLISAGVGLVFWLMTKFDPKATGLQASAKAFLTGWLGVLCLMVILTIGLVAQLSGGFGGQTQSSDSFLRLAMIATSIMMIVVGNNLPKTRANFTLGVRTPWTLSSAITWQKTHRLAGYLFLGAGLVGLIGAFVLDGAWIIAAMSGPVILASVVCVFYSWWVWKGAPDKAA